MILHILSVLQRFVKSWVCNYEEGKYVPNLDENGNWVTRVLHDGQ